MIRLSPGANRYLHLIDDRFELHGAAGQIFEDIYTPKAMWPRMLQPWPGWSQQPNNSGGHEGGSWGYECKMPDSPEGPWELRVVAEPGESEVTIHATLKNAGENPWSTVIAECCLNVRPFLWHDANGDRIRILTGKGPLQLSQADIMVCEERPNYIYHTFEQDRTITAGKWEFTWGPKRFGDGGLTTEPITEGLCVANLATLDKSQLYIGMAWDRVAYIWTNYTNCMHCTPTFGDVAPGEESVLHGKIYVTKDLDMMMDCYRKDFPGRGREH